MSVARGGNRGGAGFNDGSASGQCKAPITESYQTPLWHQPLVFLFALACFVAEWGLRRRRGLA